VKSSQKSGKQTRETIVHNNKKKVQKRGVFNILQAGKRSSLRSDSGFGNKLSHW
jgi:hypothetical protein